MRLAAPEPFPEFPSESVLVVDQVPQVAEYRQESAVLLRGHDTTIVMLAGCGNVAEPVPV